MSFIHKLGDRARDKVTGYEGIIICRSEWLYGCRRYVLQTKEKKDGKPVEAMSFDEDALEIIKTQELEDTPKQTGGPQPDPTRPPDPQR